MQYRDFGKLDFKVSALGFGVMRMPTTDGQRCGANVDERESIRMIRYAIDQGVNYIDTAYVYHGGNSEGLVGKALRDGYRAKVAVATKSPIWLLREDGDFDRYLNEQLQRLQTDCIDFYLLHSIDRKTWQGVIPRLRLIEKGAAAVRDGRIRHLGFSFHDDYDCFAEVVDAYDWSFCQIQYNYMDTENQAGTKGLKLAASKGLGVVVMEPLLGGRLANPPAAIRKVFDHSSVKRSPADLALQWIWDQPEVSTVLSGMSDMDQVKANLESASTSRLRSLQPAEFELVAKLKNSYLGRTVIPCTKCSYCMPCPSGVNIPRNFELFNDGHLHEDLPASRFTYKYFFPEPEHASNCNACSNCEEVCPQQIPVSEWMPKVAAALEG